MRRNMRQELKQSMDAISFSPQAKAAMVRRLSAQGKEQTMYKKKHSSRKFLVIALAAALIVATLTGAAVFTRWSRMAESQYSPSQQVKEQAEKSGLSVVLEDKAEQTQKPQQDKSGEVLSVTDQGITVTAVQSLVDNVGGEITFRIEGFDFPQDQYPEAWPLPTVTVGGDEHFDSSGTGWFFDGTTRNEKGEWVYAETGEPVEFDETGTVIYKPVAKDGSLEYIFNFDFMDTSGAWLGKEIVVNFTGFGVQSLGKAEEAGMMETLVEGNWELRWTLEGADTNTDGITVTPNAKIGDTGVVLTEATIGQKSMETVFQLEKYWDGWETLEPFPQSAVAVRMKDGTEISCLPRTSGYEDIDTLVYKETSNMVDGIVDLSQVESIKFLSGWEENESGERTIPVYEYVPIS